MNEFFFSEKKETIHLIITAAAGDDEIMQINSFRFITSIQQ